LTELSGCEFVKNISFMQLVISKPVGIVSYSRSKGNIIPPLLITIRFCWRNIKKVVHLLEIEVGGRIIIKLNFKN
jgi:hypothetical protein